MGTLHSARVKTIYPVDMMKIIRSFLGASFEPIRPIMAKNRPNCPIPGKTRVIFFRCHARKLQIFSIRYGFSGCLKRVFTRALLNRTLLQCGMDGRDGPACSRLLEREGETAQEREDRPVDRAGKRKRILAAWRGGERRARKFADCAGASKGYVNSVLRVSGARGAKASGCAAS